MVVRTALATVVLLLASAVGAAAAPGHGDRGAYLSLAENGLARLHRIWWNPEVQWFTTYPWQPSQGKGDRATAWDFTPVFETYELVAVAHPTPANREAADAVARGAEAYWDPAVRGYAYLPSKETLNVFFDDSGWLGLGFADAYHATHEKRFLVDAARAFDFIAGPGWAPGGGVWWDTAHEKLTSEPLAAEVLLGAELYQATHVRSYLRVVQRVLAWADAHSWNAARSLYQRNPTDPTVMDYVEGMIVGGETVLCSALHERSYCRRAERLAAAALVAFPAGYHWAPECDAIWLRGLLQLWAVDHDRRWYRFAAADAQLAAANARDADGLFTLGWDGAFAGNRRVLTDAGTLMLFAAVAAAPAPA